MLCDNINVYKGILCSIMQDTLIHFRKIAQRKYEISYINLNIKVYLCEKPEEKYQFDTSKETTL